MPAALLELAGVVVGLEPEVLVSVMVLSPVGGAVTLPLLVRVMTGVVTVELPPVCVGVMAVPGGGGERVVVTELLLSVDVEVAEELPEVEDPVEDVPVEEVELLPPVLLVGEVVEPPVLVGGPVWVAEGVHWSAERVKGLSA